MEVTKIAIMAPSPMCLEKLPGSQVEVVVILGSRDQASYEETRQKNHPRIRMELRWGQCEIIQDIPNEVEERKP